MNLKAILIGAFLILSTTGEAQRVSQFEKQNLEYLLSRAHYALSLEAPTRFQQITDDQMEIIVRYIYEGASAIPDEMRVANFVNSSNPNVARVLGFNFIRFSDDLMVLRSLPTHLRLIAEIGSRALREADVSRDQQEAKLERAVNTLLGIVLHGEPRHFHEPINLAQVREVATAQLVKIYKATHSEQAYFALKEILIKGNIYRAGEIRMIMIEGLSKIFNNQPVYELMALISKEQAQIVVGGSSLNSIDYSSILRKSALSKINKFEIQCRKVLKFSSKQATGKNPRFQRSNSNSSGSGEVIKGRFGNE